MFNKTKKSVYAFAVAVAMVVLAGCQDVKNDNLVPQGVAEEVVVYSNNRLNSPIVTYACTPKVGASTLGSKVTMQTTCATFAAGLVSTVTSLSGSSAQISVSRTDGAAFGKDGTSRLKMSNVCGNESGNVPFKAGVKKISFTVTLTHTSGDVLLVPTVTLKDESRFYGEGIKFTVTEKSPTLPWANIIFDETDFGKVKNGSKMHNGIDVMAAVDTEILSAGNGTVYSYTSASSASFGALNPDLRGPAIWILYTDVSGQPYYVLYGHIASSRLLKNA